jgi:hypothetical protein
MGDAKRDAVPEGVSTPREVTSYIRSHEADDAALPPAGLGASAPELTAESFLEDWALRHFTISVKLHDAGRLCEGDAERLLVLEELAVVQGILIELHEFASSTEAVRTLMSEMQPMQNGVSALYAWIDDLLDSALLRPVARRRPGFVDAGPDTLMVIASALERVHPDLESLVHAGTNDADGGVAHKLSLCFRQIGAAIVRVSGRATSLPPPPR